MDEALTETGESASTYSAELQRARGSAAVIVHQREGKSRLSRLYQEGCLKLRFPRLPAPGLTAVAINTAGGLTGGDRLTQEFRVEEGATLTATTQSCERIYRASAGRAQVATRLVVAPRAALSFLPQETILFDGGRIARTLDAEIEATSRLLMVESAVLGRQMMGESVTSGSFADRWRVRRDGRLVFADDLSLQGDVFGLAGHAATLGGARAFATVLLHEPEVSARLEGVRALIGAAGGASAFDGLLVVRLLAESGHMLRKTLVPLLSALAESALPPVWSI
ncbi:urease accessory protein UreD [Consotaella salsifontis]|uniref:Urease accessory protein UreD n=1 Tax=Consotaella salsifontis TaxID=1365950 RepID=A0A1T4SRK9_9HYPH|nr:urease accessory protein UreD [Consotaella salsifontis]SKA30817.1 urease accessory protein [Consotaella salsifontis]